MKARLAALLNEIGRDDEAASLIEGSRFDVFLSYSFEDSRIVKEIARRITETGLSVWFDQWNLAPGSKIGEAISEALTLTASVLVCIGPGSKNRQNFSFQEMAATYLKDDTLIVPILLPGADFKNLPDFLMQYQFIDLQDGLTSENVDLVVRAVTRSKKHKGREYN